jgi:hypothetical protein
MSLRLWTIVVDAHDPASLAHWWADVLHWKVLFENEEEVVICTPDERFPGFAFVPVPEDKQVKNRLHLDFVPDDQAAEVALLERLGARRIDIGQGDDKNWVVMADPEGNEFCVLSAREGGM